MINRIFIKDFLSFDEVDLEFDKGLVVFTGPSGAGKSILMESILSLFAIKEAKAKLAEVVLYSSINDEDFDISKNDEIVIKEIRKDKTRYLLNNQTISKKRLHRFSSLLIKHLSLKDKSDFESAKLIDSLDLLSSKTNKNFISLRNSFQEEYKKLSLLQKELNKLVEDENKVEELKEFAKFEIEKIEALDPKVEEYENLIEIKRKLSKKDKIEDAIKSVAPIFENSHYVSNALELLEVDGSFFDDAINELNNHFEKFNDTLYELEDLDIEDVLNRIEKLSSLQKRFGSIKEALEYKEQKKIELEKYENITFEKSKLEKDIKSLKIKVEELALNISNERKKSVITLEKRINHYLKFLYLSNAKILIEKKTLDSTGFDEVIFELNGVDLDTISSGEFNRLRLALLTSISEFQIVENGVLFLDEIDANLSGKESSAIATVLSELSKSYQIFAISHQPQLTSTANQHFLVDKKDGKSSVKLLNKKQRIYEISRMISGENITDEALQFATNLLK
ncbi:DNA recombination protein RecN [Malaciobacter molluscorum LMG 25693]|uniref:DNA repair protein RecN n=1 Tax=Malaciobacter molluscorum LMG 25693 TaxID=870501 RepID=A0A2G1DIU9_9BACT|nr:AAA family ATPase [Malaciobacter molluscorum]AXX93172.1 DNA repair protein RecN [Malaciobacter molluscorum LMG 25693]PHO18428.1 DNA recombination protein RecN [Malaciobacter molluscorum LMG 25693]